MKTRDEMNRMRTPTGAANAIICGLEAMCSRKDALDEAERLSEMMIDMIGSITHLGTHSRKEERCADFLDGVAERLEEWVAETTEELLQDAYGPNAERAPQ